MKTHVRSGRLHHPADRRAGRQAGRGQHRGRPDHRGPRCRRRRGAGAAAVRRQQRGDRRRRVPRHRDQDRHPRDPGRRGHVLRRDGPHPGRRGLGRGRPARDRRGVERSGVDVRHPGLTGSTPVQNVGAYGHEVAETIASVRVWDRVDNTVRTIFAADCGFSYRNSRFKADPSRYVVLEVAFQLRLGDLSAPVGYAELARVLEVEPGSRAPMTDVREAVLGLRRSKGMVLDEADHDTWSAGSFFTNPILDTAAEVPAGAPQWPQPDGRVKTSAAWLIEHAGVAKGFAIGARRGLHQAHPRAHQPRRRHRQGDPRPGRPHPRPGPPGLRHHPGQRTRPGELQPLTAPANGLVSARPSAGGGSIHQAGTADKKWGPRTRNSVSESLLQNGFGCLCPPNTQ